MDWKYFVLLYFLIPILLGILTYATLLDLVGQLLSIVACGCISILFVKAFCNTIGKPIKWK